MEFQENISLKSTSSTFERSDFNDPDAPYKFARKLKISLSIESRIFRQCVAYFLRLVLKDSVVVCSPDGTSDSSERPDVYLLEVCTGRQPVSSDLDGFLTQLLHQFGDVPVIALSDVHDVAFAKATLRAGFRGYLSPSSDIDTAVAAIRLVAAGGVYLPADLVRSWVNDVGGPMPGFRASLPAEVPTLFVDTSVARAADIEAAPSLAPNNGFTEREFEVIDRLKMGKPNKIIAYELDITESTVKVHIRNIMRKLSATNRTQVAFLTRGLLTPDPVTKPPSLCNGILLGDLAERSKPFQ